MRALVIDDDEIFSRLLVELLEDVGIGAAYSTNGLAAYGMIERDPVDLCIIDQRMPLIVGTELAEAILTGFRRYMWAAYRQIITQKP